VNKQKIVKDQKGSLMTLPTFIIGGVRRGGTTSLYYAMQQHPDIYLYPKSELNYFVEEEIDGLEWRNEPVDPKRWEETHSIEDYTLLFTKGTRAGAIGHKGADLLFWHPAHSRIARFVPHARFIFTLRHPVNRAWSHYWAEVAKGRENLSFEDALAAEDKRAGQSDWAHYHLSYRARGYYDRDLKRFFELFTRGKVLVITLEETIAQPRETLRQVYHFLKVNPEVGLDLAGTKRQQNWATLPRPWARLAGIRQLASGYERVTKKLARKLSRSKDSRRAIHNILQRPFRRPVKKDVMPAKLRSELDTLYTPHIAALEDLLERSFDEWRD
jgi:hypothetical protein